MTVSTFGVLFFSGYFAYSFYDSTKDEYSTAQLTINENVSSEEINNILLSLTSDRNHIVTSVTVSDGDVPSTVTSKENIPVIGKYSNSDKNLLLGRNFELTDNAPILIMSESSAATSGLSSPLSQSFFIGSTEYSIVGILLHSESAYIVPILYYIQNFPVSKITVLYNQPIRKSELSNILSDYSSKISSYNLENRGSPFLSSTFLPQLAQIMLIFSFTFINIIIIISLWQRYYYRQYSIYFICGLSKEKLFIIIFMQLLIVSFFSILLGFIIYLTVLPQLEAMFVVAESVLDCILICIALFSLITLFSLLLGRKVSHNIEVYKIEE